MQRRDFLKTPAALALARAGTLQAEEQPAVPKVARKEGWRANWIWCQFRPGDGYGTLNQQQARNSYFYTRKTFELPAAPTGVRARVCADSRYVLFVNGRRIGFGPPRSDPRWQMYDVYQDEICGSLQPGRNVIAALVHHVGEGTFSHMLGRIGFLFEADIEAGGKKVGLQTDDTWRVLPGLPWKEVPYRMSLQTDFPEIYDSRLEPAGWNGLDYDDSTWRKPTIIGPPPIAPWGEMVPRDIPFFGEKDVAPAAAVALGRSVAMEREHVLDTHEVFGRPETLAQRKIQPEAEIRVEIQAEGAGEIQFVLGYSNPCELFVNGTSVFKGSAHTYGDSGYLVRDQLPPVRLNAGRNELGVRLELGGRIRHFYLGHLGPADAVHYSAWSGRGGVLSSFQPLEPRVNPQTEIAVLQQTERLVDVEKPASMVTRIEPGSANTYLLLDFGKEVFGYPTLKVRADGEGLIDMGYSEALVNGRAVPNKAGLSYADRYILRPGAQDWMTFEKRAFRFMQLDFRKLTAPVEIKSVGLRFSTYPVEYKGRFQCSEEKLNRIWDVGRYTVQLNMDDAFTDCPWRERGGWMGDARVEGLVASYAFGDTRLLRHMLRLIGHSQAGDGLTYGMYPSGIDFRLPSFMLLWIHSIWDYYLHTGDSAFVSELYPKIRKAMAFFEPWVNQHGMIASLQDHYWVFIDWTPMDERGEMTTLNCFYVGTLDVVRKMAALVNQPEDGRRFAAQATRTRTALRNRVWSREKKVFVDCRTEQGMSETVSQPANALAVLYGIAPEGSERAIFEYILNPGNKVVPVGSPYFSFYLLTALYKSGMHEEALSYIRTNWSKMLDAGATTWWEEWHDRNSLCHGWSAGPTFDLMAEFVGIQPLSPGFGQVLVRPNPAGLEHASAVVPTVRGDISAGWQAGSDFSLDLELPAKVSARLSLPRLRPEWKRVEADGKPVEARAAGSRMELDWTVAGKHRFVVKR